MTGRPVRKVVPVLPSSWDLMLAAAGRRRPRLKWHMLKRRRTDPPFLRANLEAGLKAGEALEVDIVATADGHFVCLHDLTLDAETTGAGPVTARIRAEIEALGQRGVSGEVLGSPPLFLDEVVAAAAAHRQPKGGLIQIDVKDPAERYDERLVERFRETIGACGHHFVASGLDWPVIERLADATPGLRRGFDPLAMYPRGGPDSADGYETLAAATLRAAPGASIYYLEANLVLKGLHLGVNLVKRLASADVEVDVWTVDADRPQVLDVLRRLIDAGARQITTNDADDLVPVLRILCDDDR
jgi:glycerophosphoryl diester phosphodiesterase